MTGRGRVVHLDHGLGGRVSRVEVIRVHDMLDRDHLVLGSMPQIDPVTHPTTRPGYFSAVDLTHPFVISRFFLEIKN